MRRLRISGLLLLVASIACQTRDKTVEGTVETHFSRQEGIEWAIEREIDNASKSIDIGVYTFTSRPLAQALVDAKNRGVEIKVILDPSHSSTDYSKAAYLVNNGIDVHVKRGNGLMHHKFALIDDSIIINGSFNWTASAEASNDENILILKGFPSTYLTYKNEFNRLWQESELWEAAPEVLVLSATNLRQLRKNAGTEVTVKGKVVRVGHSEKSDTYFLDFSKERDGFTVVVFSSVAVKFEGLQLNVEELEGDSVEISGELVDDPEYGLEIILDEPSQIKIIPSDTDK